MSSSQPPDLPSESSPVEKGGSMRSSLDVADGVPEDGAPGVPGFKTWQGIYLFVFGWFVLLVILLAIFSRFFA